MREHEIVLNTIRRVVRTWPNLRPRDWAELRHELGRTRIMLDDEDYWPAMLEWPRGLLMYGKKGSDAGWLDEKFLLWGNLPPKATQHITDWLTFVLWPRVKARSMAIESDQSEHREHIERELEAINFAGIATNHELMKWMPVALRLVAVRNARASLSKTWPGRIAGDLVILVQGKHPKMYISQDPLSAWGQWWPSDPIEPDDPVRVALWLEESQALHDYADIVTCMEALDGILSNLQSDGRDKDEKNKSNQGI